MNFHKFLKNIKPLRLAVLKYRDKRDLLIQHSEIHFYNKTILPKLLEEVRKKDIVNVGFITWNVSLWKHHSVYTLMAQNPKFNPIIILTPTPGKDDLTQKNEIETMKSIFSQRGYNVYPEIQYNYLHYQLDIKLDILFLPQPYINHLSEELTKYILCYIPYGFSTTSSFKWCEDTFLQNIFWKVFQSSEISIKEAAKITYNHARNRVYTGYAFGDELSSPKLTDYNPWKNTGKSLKKIIWAPHFSIGDAFLKTSNFLRLYDIMFDIAEKFSDEIQIAFKPHPYLFSKLCEHPDWGKEKTLEYYQKWKDLPNGQLDTGIYTDLFKTSDAIIHDCGSFTVEYLYTNKPCFYIMTPTDTRDIDILGKEALDCYYKGTTIKEIEDFIQKVVLNNQDYMKDKREVFYNKYLLPPNGKSAAENILDEIEKSLWN